MRRRSQSIRVKCAPKVCPFCGQKLTLQRFELSTGRVTWRWQCAYPILHGTYRDASSDEKMKGEK